MPAISVSQLSKPSARQLTNALIQYDQAIYRALLRYKNDLEAQDAAIQNARSSLYATLYPWGIADLVDWSREEGDRRDNL